MAGIDPGDLDILAHELLDAVSEALNTIPDSDPGLGGAPDRAFVSPGTPAIDCCDQLTVHTAGVNEDPSGTPPPGTKHRAARINIVRLVATITRCIPGLQEDGSPPLEADLEAKADQINADGWALWNHIFNLIQADDLFTLCGKVYWDGLAQVGPSGLCAGWTLTLRVSLDGYQETL